MSNGLWRTGVWRTRWAAIGAAVAVTLGAGGLFTASAAIGSGERTVFVPITPCRIMDTRPGEPNTGPRATPIAAEETHTIDVRGANGKCTIPADAVGVSLNVTALNGTSGSFLTVFPADAAARPGASSLNWQAGQAPTPNGVVADLAADGRLSFFNFAGTVDVIADVVGYYADHNHDDRYYTEQEVDAALTAKANAADLAAKANTADVNAALATKANTTDVNAALATKANSISGTTSVLQIGPSEMVNDGGGTGTWIHDFSGGISVDSGSPCFAAVVTLPDGATVTEFEVQGFDDGATSMQANLRTNPAGAAAASIMASVNSLALGSGDFVLVDDTIQPALATVDTETRAYSVDLCLSIDTGFYSASITYTNP